MSTTTARAAPASDASTAWKETLAADEEAVRVPVEACAVDDVNSQLQVSKPAPFFEHACAPFSPPGQAHATCSPGVHVSGVLHDNIDVSARNVQATPRRV